MTDLERVEDKRGRRSEEDLFQRGCTLRRRLLTRCSRCRRRTRRTQLRQHLHGRHI